MDLKESYFDTGEVRLRVLEGPDAGPPLVLVHGATGSAADWNPVIPQLAERWHLYAYDTRGHGLSGRPAGLEGYHITHFVHDALAFLRERVKQPAVLVGHSYGAVTAMLAGMPGKDILRALVLEDPPLMLRREDDEEAEPGAFDYFGWVYRMRQSATTFDEVLAEIVKQNPKVPVEALRPWAQNLTWVDPTFALSLINGDKREPMKGVDYAAHARGIECPVLLMQADEKNGAALVQQDVDFFLANARNVKLVTFPGAGHGIHNDQTEKFLAAVDAFAAGLE